MNPRALILIRDQSLTGEFSGAFTAAGIQVQGVTWIGDVLSELLLDRFRAVVIDLECVTEGASVISDVRKSYGGQGSTIFALVPDRSQMRAAYEAGADFVLRKPVTPEKIAGSLKVMDDLRANITLAHRLLALRQPR
jgi:DNA-binding response OmpR family regulator